ncbi:MAG: peptidase M28, partial [Novosphingobium sp.]|nr:peptidase M28 [Novosphingobium sp.]
MTFQLRAAASAAAIAIGTFAAPVLAGPAEDRLIAQLLDEGLNRSDAMATASELMDGIGPRLTNSENHRKAEEWAVAKFAAYGLKNIHREPFEFGLGWNLKSYSATMTSPRSLPLTVLPVAWSPATGGAITAPVVIAPMTKVENFDAWKGKLAGKIVLVSLPGETSESKEPVFERLSGEEIGKLDKYSLPRHDPEATALQTARRGFLRKLSAFLKAEGALAMVRMTYRDGKLVHGEGYDFIPGETLALPAMDMAQEDYRRLVRLEKTGRAPQLSLAIDASYD